MTNFEELETQRVRIVDADGTLRMLITSGPLPPNLFRGESLPGPERPAAGLLFYNDEGTECGGLIFRGRTGPDGIEAGMSLNFDQYESDQVLLMNFSQKNSDRSYGIWMMDRSEKSLKDLLDERGRTQEMPEGADKERALEDLSSNYARRVFIGRKPDGEVCLELMDSKGRTRVQVSVDSKDEPKLEFLDEDGKVTYSPGAT